MYLFTPQASFEARDYFSASGPPGVSSMERPDECARRKVRYHRKLGTILEVVGSLARARAERVRAGLHIDEAVAGRFRDILVGGAVALLPCDLVAVRMGMDRAASGDCDDRNPTRQAQASP